MRARDDRGAVIPVVAALVMVLVLMAAMAFDLGTQRASRRDMQALADVVALDLARLLDGRTAADIRSGAGGKTALETAKSASVARNKSTVLGDDPSECTDNACVRVYLVDVDANGEYPESGGIPQEVAGNVAPDGVVVVASTKVGFAFSGLVGIENGAVARRALGMAYSDACYQLGSYAASITPSSSALFKDLLTPILGASTLSAAGYNGLASASVSVLDLISAPSIGVGTVEEVLALPNLTVGKLFLAAASALTGKGKIAEAAVFSSAATSVIAPVVLDFGDILAVDGASDAVLATKFNALDLLVGTAFLANGENFLSLPNLQAGLSSIGVSNTQLKIIEKARRWCTSYTGTTGPQTSQVSLTSTIKIEPNNSPLVNTGKTLLRLVNVTTGQPDATINASLNVQLAGARGVLTDVSCDPDVFDVDVWTDLITMALTGTARVKGSISATVLGVTNVDIPVQFDITVGASAFKPAATQPQHAQWSRPPLNYGDHVGVGSGDVVLPNVTVTMTPGTLTAGPVTVNVLGLPVSVPTRDLVGIVTPVIDGLLSPTGELVNRIVPIVQPLVDKVNGILVQLNQALGMNIAGADVYALEAPACDEPRLRG